MVFELRVVEDDIRKLSKGLAVCALAPDWSIVQEFCAAIRLVRVVDLGVVQ